MSQASGSQSSDQPLQPMETMETRYEIIRAVGRGAMGQVFKAYDRNLERHVALKFLRDDDPNEVSRILKEARAMARVEHEHVCKLYEAGQVDGRHYLSMQFIEGLTLDQAADELSLEQKIVVMRDVALAVQEAHGNGIIHRDLKPSNIMVEFKDDGTVKTWVMDFGVARVLSAEQTHDANVFSGTPLYMAPEQLRGRQDLDRRADVYSIGATLYELMSGRPPLMGTSSVQLIIKVMNEEPVALRKRVPSLPRDLETIIMKCLAKEADQRYLSAKALANDLQRYLDGDPIAAHPLSLTYRFSKRVRKNKALSAVIGFASIAILAMAVWAVRERRLSAYRVYLAQEFSRQAQSIENKMHLVFTMPRHEVTSALEDVYREIAAIEQQITDIGAAADGPGHYAIGRALLTISDHEGALTHLEKAEAAEYASPEFHAAMSQALSEVYRKQVNQARHLNEGPFRDQRLADLRTQYLEPARRHLSLARASGEDHYVAALVAQMDENLDLAMEMAREFAQTNPWRAEGYVLEALLLSDQALGVEDGGDYDTALDIYNKAIARLEEGIPFVESHPLIYETRDHVKQRRFEMLAEQVPGNDEAVFNDLMESLQETLSVHPGRVRTHIALAWTLQEWAYHQRDHGKEHMAPCDASVAASRKAVELAPDHPDTYKVLAMALKYRGYSREQVGIDPTDDYQEAIRTMERSLELAPRDVSALNGMGTILDVYGLYLTKTGQDSEPILRQSIGYLEKAIEINPDFAFAHNNISMPYVELAYNQMNKGQDPYHALNQARTHLEKAIELNGNYYNAHYNLGWALFVEAYHRMNRGLDPMEWLQRTAEVSQKCISINPENARGHNTMATAYVLMAEHFVNHGQDPAVHLEASRKSYRRILELTPDASYVFNDLANTYLVEGRFRLERGLDPSEPLNRALELLARSLEINPNAAMPHVNRGYAYRDLAIYDMWLGRDTSNNLARAAEQFENGLEINPNYNNAFVGRAWMFNAWADIQLRTCSLDEAFFAECQADVDRAIQLNDKDANAYRQAALLAIYRARAQSCTQADIDPKLIEVALEHAERAVSLRPNFSEYLRGRAEVIRWSLQLQPSDNQMAQQMVKQAMDSLQQARDSTQFSIRCDLEEAYLLSVLKPDKEQWVRAQQLARKVSNYGGALAIEADRLLDQLDARIKAKPGGS